MVKVTFGYEPDEPDDDDPTGMTEDEYLALMDKLGEIGAIDITVEKV